MNVYTAALYSTRDEVRETVARRLTAAGHEVTARWLWDEEPPGSEPLSAAKDLEDVDRSDVLLLLTLPYGTMYTGGGRAWEAGYAMGLGKRVYVLGDHEIIFCHHPEVHVFRRLDGVLHHMAQNPVVSRPRAMLDWCHQTFGDVALDRVERAVRLLEEAMELAQTQGISPTLVQRLADRVFSRPAGVTLQEVGQVQNLLECLAENLGLCAREAGRREFDRCRAVPQEEWDRRHAEKVERNIANLEGDSCSSLTPDRES
jgi:nucleoside 2-deoxyribosyltransferase